MSNLGRRLLDMNAEYAAATESENSRWDGVGTSPYRSTDEIAADYESTLRELLTQSADR